jgi:hypothetical protein
VYLSTKNISMPKGRARKLAPKYLGPFPITKVIKEGATYQLGLSDELIKRGVNRSFHASLLRPHVPNDDRRFPGRLPMQIPGFGEKPDEWIVDSIVSHNGKGTNSEFLVKWKAGDKTWATYREVAHLIALDRYCEIMGVGHTSELPPSYVRDNFDNSEEGEDNILVNRCYIEIYEEKDAGERYIREGSREGSLRSSTMVAFSSLASEPFTPAEYERLMSYKQRLDNFIKGGPPVKERPPPRYEEFLAYIAPHAQTHAPAYPIVPPSNPYYGFHHPPTNYHPNPDTVSMPARSLEAIMNVIEGRRESPRYSQPYAAPSWRGSHDRAMARMRFRNRGRGGFRGNRNYGRPREDFPRHVITIDSPESTAIEDGNQIPIVIDMPNGDDGHVDNADQGSDHSTGSTSVYHSIISNLVILNDESVEANAALLAEMGFGTGTEGETSGDMVIV